MGSCCGIDFVATYSICLGILSTAFVNF